MKQLWLKAWLLCGTLDALYATLVALLRGTSTTGVWLGVASGPFGDSAQQWGAPGVLAGLAVHFALMAVMAAVGLWLARNTPLGDVAPWKAGTLYGLALYCAMYGLVLHFRFGLPFPNPDRVKLAIGLFPHIFFVGIPMFYLFKRTPQLS
ncbi:MAG: hypothetical protein QFC78_05025 [Pseudomonadota bacterium]|nr:hypothetical protein [Pseudomonadota bacterium]